MNSFFIFGIIFIPLYIMYNWICFKRKKVSIWIGSKSMWMISKKVEVLDDIYFKYQFKCSVITCLLMLIFIIMAIVLEINEGSLPLLIVVFCIAVTVIKYLAIKKGYINVISL